MRRGNCAPQISQRPCLPRFRVQVLESCIEAVRFADGGRTSHVGAFTVFQCSNLQHMRLEKKNTGIWTECCHEVETIKKHAGPQIIVMITQCSTTRLIARKLQIDDDTDRACGFQLLGNMWFSCIMFRRCIMFAPRHL